MWMNFACEEYLQQHLDSENYAVGFLRITVLRRQYTC